MDEVIVIDLESSNGTFVDGKKLSGGGPLASARAAGRLPRPRARWRIRKEVEESQELDRELEQAWHYIQSMLPAPLATGPIQADWVLVPCTRLGGDAFGYRFLDSRHFAIYLIDVSGHGTGAAMHAVSVIQRASPDHASGSGLPRPREGPCRIECDVPHGDARNLYLTVWYGVYDLETRTLAYGSAGHHPSYLVGLHATARRP